MCLGGFSPIFALENEEMFHVKQIDVLVIGGGHAGCEASLSSARMGLTTLMVTMDPSKTGEMSCNPSIGGVGKGQLAKEIDALGGEMGKNADITGIQFKRLNMRKGSAVQSSRCQSDKKKYAQRMQGIVGSQHGLEVLQGEVKRLQVEAGRITGVQVRTPDGTTHDIPAKTVVITSGTFMRGLMHTGFETTAGGRAGEAPSQGLSDQLRELNLPLLRLKTGTPPRLLRGSIDFTVMQEQFGDNPPRRFSFSDTKIELPQVACFLTYTSPDTHSVIRGSLDRSPLYSGKIQGVGPRYCPSIEDKVVKFPEKPRHQLFFEPEALDSDWIYPNGVSTSLPADVQEAFMKTIPGCESVKFARYGYAVEYDCVDPIQLKHSLESKLIEGLFLAGQVNGTSGYEEAGAQGLIAGINAALKVQRREPMILSRAEAYIGVMIDDLVTCGVTEPYRMFTSRAEFRLSLREDNADARLRPRGREIGLVNDEDFARFTEKARALETARVYLTKTWVKPTSQIQEKLATWATPPLATSQTYAQLLRRPELGLEQVSQLTSDPAIAALDPEMQETLEVEVKYEGYIGLQKEEIERVSRMGTVSFPESFEFSDVKGLSYEIREKLSRLRPKTLADASRLSGVTPAALSTLLFHLRQKGNPSANPTSPV